MSQTTLADRSNQLDQYIVQQVHKAGAQVRLIDLFTSVMSLFAGVLGFLFLMSLIDAWVLELGVAGRWICFVLLLLGAGYYTLRVIVPLLIRKINPAYAAKVVESSHPSLKNSLLNYILLRRSKREIPRPVIEAIGSQAASKISGMAVENTVDKSHTIRIATLLTALVIFFGAYKIISPKDPFQTFARIFAPASNISYPARVRFANVQPGNDDVYFGQKLQVSADIAGTYNDRDVRIEFSTRDGQIVDRQIPMTRESRTGKFQGVLQTGSSGIEQGLTYRIIAGDGQTKDYQINLKSTPTMTVESILYEPPAYTGLPQRTTEGTSEIEAIEGSKVAMTVLANTEISSSHVELLLQNEKTGDYRAVGTVSMENESETRARCQFVLHLDSARENQKYTHYRLRFVTSDGQRNEPIAAYPIRVIPDLAPQIQIVEPVDANVSIPANSRLRFRIRASDPDFEIESIQILTDHRGSRMLRDRLKLGDQDPSQQIEAHYDFWPKKLNLPAGSTAIVSFAAFDNRRSALYDAPDPNVTMTGNVVISVIDSVRNPPPDSDDGTTEPNSGQDGKPSDQGNQSDSQSGNEDAQSNSPPAGQNNESPENNAAGENAGEQSSQSDSQNSADQNNNDQKSSDQQADGAQQKNSSQSSGDQSEQQEDGSQSQSGSQSGSQSQSNETGDPSSGQTGNQSASANNSSQNDASNASQSGSASDSQSNNAGETGSGQTPSAGSSNDENQSNSSRVGNASNQSQSSDSSDASAPGATGGSDNTPLDENAPDGKVFDRIMKYRQKQEQSQAQQSPSGDSQTNDSQAGNQSGDSQTNENRASDSQTSDSQASDSQTGDSQASDSQAGGNQPDLENSRPSEAANNDSNTSDSSAPAAAQSQSSASSQDSQSDTQQSDTQQSDTQQSDTQQSDTQQSDSGAAGQESATSTDANKDTGSPPGSQTTGQPGAEQKDAPNSGAANQGEQSGATEKNEKDGASGGDQDSLGQPSPENQDLEKQSSGGGGQPDEQKPNQSAGGGAAEKNKSSGSSGQPEEDQSKSGGQQPGSSQGSGEPGSQPGAQPTPGSAQDSPTNSGGDQQSSAADASQASGSSSGNSSGDSQSTDPADASQAASQQPTNSQNSTSPQGDPSQSGEPQGRDPISGSESSQGNPGSTSQPSDARDARDPSQSKASSSENSQSAQPGAGSSNTGSAPGDVNPNVPDEQAPTQADEANLEYTQKATDLVLDYLKDQEVEPDPKLLDELSWSENDLRDFLKRWREMKNAASSGDEQDKKQWEQALKSLGMAPPNSQKRAADVDDDNRSGYTEDARVIKPPVDLAERFRAYQKRRNRASDR